MDFFSTGEFQQLFNDLLDQTEYDTSEQLEFYAHIPGNIQADLTSEKYQKDREFNDYCDNHFDRFENYTDSSLHSCNNFEDSNNNTLYPPVNSEPLLALCTTEELNLEINFNLHSLCGYDMDSWEEQFLDSLIELPEILNDVLPDRTPLCSESCDLHIQESSEYLKLNQKSPSVPSLSPSISSSSSPSPSPAMSEKGYQCTYENCCKIYSKPAHLKAHLRRHFGEKPYACTWPECAWKFSRSDELARHRRSHSGVKPYKCDYCIKCFARSDHLKKHRKVHERRLLAASKAGSAINGIIPASVLNVRPGRKRKNQLC